MKTWNIKYFTCDGGGPYHDTAHENTITEAIASFLTDHPMLGPEHIYSCSDFNQSGILSLREDLDYCVRKIAQWAEGTRS